ncbi:MAG TPA: MarR family transcriptional regulator [Candidatus Binataceae bacterium]|nr:MarR family transcriptional regulator [Candidatus Binataceae bacterium]
MNRRSNNGKTPDEQGSATTRVSAGAAFPPDRSVGYLVREAHRAFLRALAARVSRYGVTIGMWYFLRALWEEDGLTQRELSRRVGMMEPTTATALDSMQRRGLISRTRDAGDRRKVIIRLTEEGQRLREVLLACAIEVNEIALAGIAPQRLSLLRDQLIHIRSNLDADANRDSERGEAASAAGRISLREPRQRG